MSKMTPPDPSNGQNSKMTPRRHFGILSRQTPPKSQNHPKPLRRGTRPPSPTATPKGPRLRTPHGSARCCARTSRRPAPTLERPLNNSCRVLNDRRTLLAMILTHLVDRIHLDLVQWLARCGTSTGGAQSRRGKFSTGLLKIPKFHRSKSSKSLSRADGPESSKSVKFETPSKP